MAKPKQEAGFFKGGMVGEFVNVDAAIGKDAAVAIDITNAGGGGNNAFQAFTGRSAGHAGHNFSLNSIGCGNRAGRCAGRATVFYTRKDSYSPDRRVTSVHAR